MDIQTLRSFDSHQSSSPGHLPQGRGHLMALKRGKDKLKKPIERKINSFSILQKNSLKLRNFPKLVGKPIYKFFLLQQKLTEVD